MVQRSECPDQTLPMCQALQHYVECSAAGFLQEFYFVRLGLQLLQELLRGQIWGFDRHEALVLDREYVNIPLFRSLGLDVLSPVYAYYTKSTSMIVNFITVYYAQCDKYLFQNGLDATNTRARRLFLGDFEGLVTLAQLARMIYMWATTNLE